MPFSSWCILDVLPSAAGNNEEIIGASHGSKINFSNSGDVDFFVHL